MRLAAALAAVAAAVLCVLLAHDVRAQRTASPTVLPQAVTERLLDLGPQRRLRRAIRLYERARTDRGARVAAERALGAAAQDDDPRRASQALDLLALLTFRRGTAASAGQAVGELQTAIRLDPSNDAAKANLELMLRLLEAHGARPGPAATSGPRGQGRHGAGSATSGAGY